VIGLGSALRFQSTAAPLNASTVDAHGKKPMTVERELPDPFKDRNRNRIQFVSFWILMGVSAVLIFNYEKTTSPIVTTTLHFLRRSQIIREVLGDKIDFSSFFPWISGELNQVKGVVNIKFEVSGTKKSGIVRLVADRENKNQDFLIHEWSLTVDDKTYDLFDDKTVDFGI
jgi:cytochrome c oxidase assembly factor 1